MPFGIITAGLLGGLLSGVAKSDNSRIVGGAAKRKLKRPSNKVSSKPKKDSPTTTVTVKVNLNLVISVYNEKGILVYRGSDLFKMIKPIWQYLFDNLTKYSKHLLLALIPEGEFYLSTDGIQDSKIKNLFVGSSVTITDSKVVYDKSIEVDADSKTVAKELTHLGLELTVRIPNELSLHKKELSEVIAYTIMDQGVNTWAGNPPLLLTINKEGDVTSENVAYIIDFFYECPESDLIKISPRNDPFNHHNPYLKWSVRNEYLKKLNKLK